jgi:hypothetical protein
MQAMAGDFAPGAAYFTTTGGYQRLPLTLGAMARHAGAAIHLEHLVVRVGSSASSRPWAAEFPSRSRGQAGPTTEGLLQSTFRYRPPPWLPEGTGIST